MQRIETRVQLINFVCENISRRAISRACHSGTVQVMGGFSHVLPSQRPGWIVSVTSVHGRTWLVAVTAHDHQHVFHAWVVEKIPWEYYVGTLGRETYSIYNGDHPEQAYIAWTRANDKTNMG